MVTITVFFTERMKMPTGSLGDKSAQFAVYKQTLGLAGASRAGGVRKAPFSTWEPSPPLSFPPPPLSPKCRLLGPQRRLVGQGLLGPVALGTRAWPPGITAGLGRCAQVAGARLAEGGAGLERRAWAPAGSLLCHISRLCQWPQPAVSRKKGGLCSLCPEASLLGPTLHAAQELEMGAPFLRGPKKCFRSSFPSPFQTLLQPHQMLCP